MNNIRQFVDRWHCGTLPSDPWPMRGFLQKKLEGLERLLGILVHRAELCAPKLETGVALQSNDDITSLTYVDVLDLAFTPVIDVSALVVVRFDAENVGGAGDILTTALEVDGVVDDTGGVLRCAANHRVSLVSTFPIALTAGIEHSLSAQAKVSAGTFRLYRFRTRMDVILMPATLAVP